MEYIGYKSCRVISFVRRLLCFLRWGLRFSLVFLIAWSRLDVDEKTRDETQKDKAGQMTLGGKRNENQSPSYFLWDLKKGTQAILDFEAMTNLFYTILLLNTKFEVGSRIQMGTMKLFHK